MVLLPLPILQALPRLRNCSALAGGLLDFCLLPAVGAERHSLALLLWHCAGSVLLVQLVRALQDSIKGDLRHACQARGVLRLHLSGRGGRPFLGPLPLARGPCPLHPGRHRDCAGGAHLPPDCRAQPRPGPEDPAEHVHGHVDQRPPRGHRLRAVTAGALRQRHAHKARESRLPKQRLAGDHHHFHRHDHNARRGHSHGARDDVVGRHRAGALRRPRVPADHTRD
mmetsp:Transcript_66001/g.193107  ORF Transcript_66001/g.193107 Transcript_66001/m.193107 type:complete len:225 (-) Transcript_66001:555-1229(-)